MSEKRKEQKSRQKTEGKKKSKKKDWAARGGRVGGVEERSIKVKENLQCLQGEEQHQTLGCRVSLAAEILWLYYCSTGRAGLVLG